MKLTINLANKKLLKKILAISLPALVIGASITTYLVKTKDDDSKIVNNNIDINNGVKRQVYLLTEDNLLMPVTLTVEKKEQLTDEIVQLVNLLKEDSSLVNDNFKPVLSKECELKNVLVEDNVVTLNFNKEFENYDQVKEKRIVESLVWTCLQFDELDTLKLQVEDKILNYMPLNNTPLNENLSKDIGINSHLVLGNTNQRSVNVFYERTIDDNSFYIPVTIKVEDKENDYQEVIDGMNFKLPIYSNLKTPSLLNKIEVLQYSELDENNNLNLTLSNKALYDENTLDSKVFDYLVMNLINNDENIQTVSFTVDNEVVSVNGYEENVIAVNSLTYNEIKV